MTLRLNAAETAELREAAEREGKSMQSFARDAVLDAARRHAHNRDQLIETFLREDAEALDRLAH